MRSKRVFLNLTIIIITFMMIGLFVYAITSFLLMGLFADYLTPYVVKIVNTFDGMTATFDTVVDYVTIGILASDFLALVFGFLKLKVLIKIIGYYKMSYAEFYTSRYKYLGVVILDLFTFTLLIDFLLGLMALWIKDKNADTIEKDLSSESVRDVEKNVIRQGQGVTGGSYVPSVSAKSGNTSAPKISLQSASTEALDKLRDLYNSGMISPSEYKKLEKKIQKGKRV